MNLTVNIPIDLTNPEECLDLLLASGLTLDEANHRIRSVNVDFHEIQYLTQVEILQLVGLISSMKMIHSRRRGQDLLDAINLKLQEHQDNANQATR